MSNHNQQPPICIEISSTKLEDSPKKNSNWKKVGIVSLISFIVISLFGYFLHRRTPCTGNGCPVTNSYYSFFGIRPSRTISIYQQDKIDPKSEEFTLVSPFSGKILNIFVSEGSQVQKDDNIFEVEIMKMNVIVKAKHSGTISKIHANERDLIEGGANVISLKA